MGIGASAGTEAVDKLDAVTIPEAQRAITDVLAPFAALAVAIEAVLGGGKKLVITLEDK